MRLQFIQEVHDVRRKLVRFVALYDQEKLVGAKRHEVARRPALLLGGVVVEDFRYSDFVSRLEIQLAFRRFFLFGE